jgi:hypothetical protein
MMMANIINTIFIFITTGARKNKTEILLKALENVKQ